MDYYLGIDIGTTSTKAVAFSATGETIAYQSVAYAISHPYPDFKEQDPEEIFNAVVTVINKLTSDLLPHQPLFISFSTAMHSVMAVDKEGKPLTGLIIWADNRAKAIAEELLKNGKGKEFYKASGVPIHPMSPLCKILWLKKNVPDVFAATFKFIGIKEYIFYKLFNDYVIDTSLASTTGLLNITTLDWHQEILQYAGITSSLLSKIVHTQTIFYLRSPVLAISSATPIVIGASDGALSNLGSGAVGAGSLAVTIGTSGAVRMVTGTPEVDEENNFFCYHLYKNKFIIGAPTNNGAVVLQWLKENILQTDESYEALFDLAATVPAGADGLIFLPYLMGERAPIWNADAKGIFFGFTINHSKAHLIKACIEGVVFSLYSIGKNILQQHLIDTIYASGGFARSALWLQVLADVFNKKVIINRSVQSAALGAVIVGIEALGLENKINMDVTQVYEPLDKNVQLYQQAFQKFERLYEKLKDEM